MSVTEADDDVGERPAAVVRIAYHQLSLMYGVRDPTEPPAPMQPAGTNGPYMVCARRLLRLPFLVAASRGCAGLYDTLKTSHGSVESTLNLVEASLRNGAAYVRPFFARVAETLERPLRSVDNVICVGLDLLEEKPPAGETKG